MTGRGLLQPPIDFLLEPIPKIGMPICLHLRMILFTTMMA